MSLARVEQLAIASVVAPVLRDTPATARRPVKVTNAQGEVIRTVSRLDVAKGVLARAGIELDVAPGQRPTHKVCACERIYKVLAKGKIPDRCPKCEAERFQCTAVIDGKRCASRLNAETWRLTSVKKRKGKPPMCLKCRNRARSPEQQREAGRRLQATRTPEQRSEDARKGNATRTPEQRSETARKVNATRTPEQHREAARRRQAARTPEQRSEASRKAAATCRAKAAERATVAA